MEGENFNNNENQQSVNEGGFDPMTGQPVNQQPAYQQPVVDETVGVGEWMLTTLLCCIPIVNIVLMFVWSFGNNTKPSKKNWARAALIWVAIVLVLYIILIAVFGATIASSMY